jgi:hypothetical protein
VEPRRSPLEYLKIGLTEGTIARLFPIGVVEHGFDERHLERFRQEVFAQIAPLDPTRPCEIVYGGKRVSDELY